MKKTLYFISGMPRAGSTLLCNILSQNPQFHATQTSGCMDVLFNIRNHWDKLVEHKAHPDPAAKLSVLRAALNAYHENIEKPIIFDKGRGWISNLEMIEEIIEAKVKVLVPIRPIPDILTSFELLYRKTAKTRQPPGEAENYFQFQTMQGRCDYWSQNNQTVGIAYNRVKDAIQRLPDRLHFVTFENLTRYPGQTMRAIYNFLKEPYFEHNFDHVEQVTQEDDSVHGFINLHKIRNKVEPVQSRALEILGPELVKKFTVT